MNEGESYTFNFHQNEGYACVVRFKPEDSSPGCCYMRDTLFGDSDVQFRKYLCTDMEAARSGCRRRGQYIVEDGIGKVCELSLEHLSERDFGGYVAIMPVGESKHHAISLQMKSLHKGDQNVSFMIGLTVGLVVIVLLAIIIVVVVLYCVKTGKFKTTTDHNLPIQSPIEETPVEKTGKSESKKNKKEQEAKNNTHKDQRARIHENNTRDKVLQFESMAQHGSDHIKIIH